MIRSGTRFYFAKDQLGSIRAVINADSGVVAQAIHYDEFGRVLADSNPGFQPFGFAGGHYDFETDLVRFGARDYDPEAGRWLSKDPILFAGGDGNLYSYVASDPINAIDPSGMLAEDEAESMSLCYVYERMLNRQRDNLYELLKSRERSAKEGDSFACSIKDEIRDDYAAALLKGEQALSDCRAGRKPYDGVPPVLPVPLD